MKGGQHGSSRCGRMVSVLSFAEQDRSALRAKRHISFLCGPSRFSAPLRTDHSVLAASTGGSQFCALSQVLVERGLAMTGGQRNARQ